MFGEKYFIFSTFTKSQQIELFQNLVENDFDFDAAVGKMVSDNFKHDEIDLFMSKEDKLIFGVDHLDNGSELIHLYSNRNENIDNYLHELIEAGEIFTTIKHGRHKQMKFYRCLESLNVENTPERPILPLCYN